jgi:peptidylprolyl isomerase
LQFGKLSVKDINASINLKPKMNKLFKSFIIIMLAMNISHAQVQDPENTLVIKLKDGDVVVELYPEKAPEHVKRIKELAREGFYNNIVFHRVIEGFMAQTGDPTGTGMGGSKKPDLKAEFNDIKHVKGVMSMARSASPNSANSQFFIMLADSPHLDGQYTAFGKVIKGMEFVDKIKKGNRNDNGSVTDPDKMLNVSVLADTEKKAAK